MGSRFIMSGEVPVSDFDWGSAGMRCGKENTGCRTFVVLDVTLAPGFCHDFHRHPDQDEMIIVKSGRITQYIEGESAVLGAGAGM
jgi:quercetin dioxygenase-like cupin family protein